MGRHPLPKISIRSGQSYTAWRVTPKSQQGQGQSGVHFHQWEKEEVVLGQNRLGARQEKITSKSKLKKKKKSEDGSEPPGPELKLRQEVGLWWGRRSLFECVLPRGEGGPRSRGRSRGLPQKDSPRNPGAGEGKGALGARSKAGSRVSDTTSGPGRSPWGGGFRVAMIPPAACSEGGPRPPSSPHSSKSHSRPRWKSMVSFFLLLLYVRCPVPAPSSPRRVFRASARWVVGRSDSSPTRACGSCSLLPSATLVSHPTPS